MDKKIRVVIAEDVDILRAALANTIRSDSRFILLGEASCGKDLVKLCLENEVDVVITDIEMDNQNDGIAAVSTIIEEKPEIGAIFLTVHEEEALIYQAFGSAERVDYIIKSPDYNKLKESIVNLYNGTASINFKIANKIKQEFVRMRRAEESLLYILDIFGHLTKTEKELIGLLLEGKNVPEIAKMRSVEVVTVRSQINTLLKKFHYSRTFQIVHLIKDMDLQYLFLKE